MKAQLLARFGMSEEELISQIKFEAVMVFSYMFCMELNMQVIIDTIMSKDGRIGGPLRSKSDPQTIPVYITNPDLTFPESFVHARISL